MDPWRKAGEIIGATVIAALVCYIVILSLWMLIQPLR